MAGPRSDVNRTIAVGDIHGCAASLTSLVRALDLTPDDTLVTLGDVIDRGPDSRGVVEHLMTLSQRCRLVGLRGNHEDMLFEVLAGRMPLRSWMRFGGDRALDSYGVLVPRDIPRDHLDFLRTWRSYHETATHIFVHAGCRPDLPVREQPIGSLMWGALLVDEAAPHCSGKTVVVGHTVQEDVLDLGFLIGLDTGAAFDGWLTALDVGSRRFWQANERGQVRAGLLPPWPGGDNI